MSDNYCVKCEAYAMYPTTYAGKQYCPQCYTKLRIREVEEPAPIGESQPVEIDCSANVPLALQKKLLRSTFYDTVLWLQEMLEDDDFMADLEEMAEARLEQGYKRFGSTMYGWNDERRFRAIMEELADIFVYRCSE